MQPQMESLVHTHSENVCCLYTNAVSQPRAYLNAGAFFHTTGMSDCGAIDTLSSFGVKDDNAPFANRGDRT